MIRGDERGVAPVVAFVLLFGLVVIGLGVAQATIPGQQAASTSQQHWEAVNQDMSELRQAMDRVGDTGSEARVAVELGRELPDTPLLVEGVPPRGTLATREATVTVRSATSINPGASDPTTLDVRSNFLVYSGQNPSWTDIESWIGPVSTWDRQGDALTSIESPGSGDITILSIRGNISRASASTTTLRVAGVGVSCSPVEGTTSTEIEITPPEGPQPTYDWPAGEVRQVCIKTVALGAASPTPAVIGSDASDDSGFAINPTDTLQLSSVTPAQKGGGPGTTLSYVNVTFDRVGSSIVNLTAIRVPFATLSPPGASPGGYDTVRIRRPGSDVYDVDVGDPFESFDSDDFEITGSSTTIGVAFGGVSRTDLQGTTFVLSFRTEEGRKLIYFVAVPD